MNIIQRQADTFYKIKFKEYPRINNEKEFIDELRYQLTEYYRSSEKLEFIDRILTKLKLGYEKHLEECSATDKGSCRINIHYEDCMFFSKNEKDKIIDTLDTTDLSIRERQNFSKNINEVIEKLSTIQLGQKITYDDLYDEIVNLKNLYYLNKKDWISLLIGKINEKVAGKIFDEAVGKEIIDIVNKGYNEIIENL